MELKEVDRLIDNYSGEEGVLIQLLLDIQNEFRWIPKEAIVRTSQRLRVPLSEIYRVASFYKGMSLIPTGRHLVQICLGTACHVRGGPKILEKTEEFMKIPAGSTTADQKFTLKRVNCLGCCALGPVMSVDGEYHGKLAPSKVADVLENYH